MVIQIMIQITGTNKMMICLSGFRRIRYKMQWSGLETRTGLRLKITFSITSYAANQHI